MVAENNIDFILNSKLSSYHVLRWSPAQHRVLHVKSVISIIISYEGKLLREHDL